MKSVSAIVDGIRADGEMIVRKMIAVLDRGEVVQLDCGHPLGGEHKGRFNMVQIENGMFVIVCEACKEFAMVGENIIGESKGYSLGRA